MDSGIQGDSYDRLGLEREMLVRARLGAEFLSEVEQARDQPPDMHGGGDTVHGFMFHAGSCFCCHYIIRRQMSWPAQRTEEDDSVPSLA